MARPVYPYELGDPDFAWLLATYQESNPDFKLVDISCLPLTLIKVKTGALPTLLGDTDLAHPGETTSENDDEIFDKT